MRINFYFVAAFLACLCVVTTRVTGEREIAPAGTRALHTDGSSAVVQRLTALAESAPPQAQRVDPTIVIDLK